MHIRKSSQGECLATEMVEAGVRCVQRSSDVLSLGQLRASTPRPAGIKTLGPPRRPTPVRNPPTYLASIAVSAPLIGARGPRTLELPLFASRISRIPLRVCMFRGRQKNTARQGGTWGGSESAACHGRVCGCGFAWSVECMRWLSGQSTRCSQPNVHRLLGKPPASPGYSKYKVLFLFFLRLSAAVRIQTLHRSTTRRPRPVKWRSLQHPPTCLSSGAKWGDGNRG